MNILKIMPFLLPICIAKISYKAIFYFITSKNRWNENCAGYIWRNNQMLPPVDDLQSIAIPCRNDWCSNNYHNFEINAMNLKCFHFVLFSNFSPSNETTKHFPLRYNDPYISLWSAIFYNIMNVIFKIVEELVIMKKKRRRLIMQSPNVQLFTYINRNLFSCIRFL